MEDLNNLFLRLQQSNPRLLEQIMSSNPMDQANNILQRLGSLKESNSLESTQDDIQQMQQLYATMQERKGRRAPLISKQQLILQHRMQREKRIQQKSQGHIPTMLTTSYIFDVYHSKVTDLSTLKSIHIEDLLLETWHEGRYLLCRTIEEAYRMNGIISLVEDETGRIAMLTLYNFSKALSDSAEECLPLNTILLIKEPYFKGISNGGATVRCDSPSDIIIINYNDENYKKFKISSIQQWSSLCAKADRVHASPCPKTPSDFKARGNDLYKIGYDKDAVRAYTLGIAACQNDVHPQDKDIENICRLNRSASYLRMGRFDDAASDAVSVLGSLPQNIKALFRAATAYYQLRSYKLALKYFEELCTLSPSNKKDLLLCQQRIKEQETGSYDWKSLKAIANASPTKAIRFDVADYFNTEAVEIRQISKEKGRGVFAKHDIPPGTLLLVSKAFSTCFVAEVNNVNICQLYLKTRGINRTSQVQLITNVMHKVLECPSLGSSLYQLWSGGYKEIFHSPSDTDECNKNIDFDYIYHICKYNSFSTATADSLKDAMGMEGNSKMNLASSETDDGSGLWINSSFFNHSCIPNTTSWTFGDLMVIMCSRYTKAGEEVTVSYVSTDKNLRDRQEVMKSFNFICQCELCTMQDGLDEERLDNLMQTYNEEISPRIRTYDLRVIPVLERHIRAIKDVYANNSQHKFLFKIIDMMGGLALLYRYQGRMKDALNTYEQAFLLQSNLANIEDYIKGKEIDTIIFISEPLELLARQIQLAYSSLGNSKKAKKWSVMVTKLGKLHGKDWK